MGFIVDRVSLIIFFEYKAFLNLINAEQSLIKKCVSKSQKVMIQFLMKSAVLFVKFDHCEVG